MLSNSCWMDKFEYFLHIICDQYENVVIAGDFNLPNINWVTMENTTGVNELFFVQMLNGHYLSQLNHTPSRGNNILDFVITNVPDNVNLTQIYYLHKIRPYLPTTILSHLTFLLLSGNREH